MKLRFLSIFVLALVCSTSVVRADELTVADGTSSSNYSPVNGPYADDNSTTKTQVLYSSTLLTDLDGKSITNIKFYAAKAFDFPGATFKIRFAEVTETQLTGFVSSSFTEVYSGALAISASYEMAIELDAAYAYGGGNLLMEIEQVQKATDYDYPGFVGTGVTKASYGNKASYGSAGSLNFLPKTTFTYAEGAAVTCPKPSALTPGTITANSASFSWTKGGTETQWDYVLANGTDAPDWTKETTVSTASVTLSSLNPSTTYTLYVRAHCGTDDRSKVLSSAFTTPCGAISTLPWEYGFEDGVQDKMPNCWSKISTSKYPYVDVYNYYARTGSKYLYFYGGNKEQMAILPQFAEDLDKLSISFYYHAYENTTYSTYATPQVGYVTDPADASTFVEIAAVPQHNDEYIYFETPLTGAPAGAYIALRYYTSGASSYGSFYVEDMTVFLSPSCMKPTNVTAVAAEMTANSAKITWEAGKSETQWQYICVAKDGIVLWDGITPTTDKFATVTGLSSNTEYDFYVRSYCAVGDQSEAVKITFKTEVSCFQPETATVSDVTATGAKIDWTASGKGEKQYQYVVVKSGVTPDWSKATLTTEGAALSAEIAGLDPSTDYAVYIRSYCAAGDQSEAIVTSFKTDCGPISTLPWSEDFESQTAGYLPDCWGRTHTSYPQVYSWYAYEGSKCMYIWGGTTAIAGALPEFAEPIKNLSISFYYNNRDYTDDKYPSAKVGYMTDPNDITTFVSLQDLGKVKNYSLVELNLKNAPDEAKRIAFWYGDGTSTGMILFDNITVFKTPTCPNVGEISWNTRNYDGGKFVWSQGADENRYQWACVEKGQTVATWNLLDTDVREVYITGLTPGKEYDFVVRAYCDAGVQGAESRYTFMPECKVPTGLDVIAVTNDRVLIEWEGNGASKWIVKCDGRTIESTTTIAIFEGLASATDYTIQVASAEPCESEYCTAVSFKTRCDAMADTYLPYSQDFEAVAAGSLPDCWSVVPEAVGTQVIEMIEGGKRLYMEGADERWIILPTFEHAVNDLAITYSATGSVTLELGYMTDENITTFVAGELSNAPANAKYIVFHYQGSATWSNAYLDDVVLNVKGAPSGIDELQNAKGASKRMEDGRLIIIRDGVRYDAVGSKIE